MLSVWESRRRALLASPESDFVGPQHGFKIGGSGLENDRPEGRKAMYAAIRQFKAKPGSADALAEKIKEAISIISDVSGFMGYYVVYAPDDTVTAISVFNTVAEAQESNRRALAFIEESLGPLVIGQASATAGPVIVHSLP
jgi:quinol monooxygenase YgiN